MVSSHEGNFGPVEPLIETRARDDFEHIVAALNRHLLDHGTFYDQDQINMSARQFTNFPNLLASLYEPSDYSEHPQYVAGSAFSFAMTASGIINPNYVGVFEADDYLGDAGILSAEMHLGNSAQLYLGTRPTLERLIGDYMPYLTERRRYRGLAKTVAALTFKQIEQTAQARGIE
jgi:hypothetical protein